MISPQIKKILTTIFNLSLAATTLAQSPVLLAKLQKQDIHVAAHRAAHNHAPENSIAAIDAAIELGVSIVELDVRATKDGVLVLMHDQKLDRTTNGKGKISDYSYAEIQQLYLRETANGSIGEHRIPTFQEVLKHCKGKVIIDIDYKEDRAGFIEKTYALIEEEQMQDQVLFFLYEYQKMPELHALNPTITLFPRARSMDDLRKIMELGMTKVVHLDDSFTKAKALNSCKEQGYFFWMNSLGEADEKAQKKGGAVYTDFLKRFPFIRIVQTDAPALWQDVLKIPMK